MDKIRLEHVSFVYGDKTPFRAEALHDVSLSFGAGRVTGLIGHTGSGKSTMLQLLNGLEKPNEGKIYLDGQDIFAKPREMRQIRFRVGLVMQYPEYQLFEETVRSDIAFGPRNMGLSDEEIAVRVTEAANFTGLPSALLDKSPFDLSGGEKRRAAIAGVMAMRPEVLVLDEPAAGLDPRGRDSILGGVRAYKEATGATVIIVSHSMEDMAMFCDDLVVLSKGKVLFTGTRDEVFSRVRELEEVGLAVPQMARLMMLLREKGLPVPENIYTVSAATEAVAALFE